MTMMEMMVGNRADTRIPICGWSTSKDIKMSHLEPGGCTHALFAASTYLDRRA